MFGAEWAGGGDERTAQPEDVWEESVCVDEKVGTSFLPEFFPKRPITFPFQYDCQEHRILLRPYFEVTVNC